jgi:GT2 family glycosyltransferase/glycosyltransferase involved in cell wall biosynthesis
MTRLGETADDTVVLTRDAQLQGQRALVAGDSATAMRWLDRAHRLAPHDGTVTLALATACLRRDTARAASLFLAVAEAEDVRAAWLGLAAARLSLSDAAGAAEALAGALARHVPETGVEALADAIVRGAGAAGWCGIGSDGLLVIGGLTGQVIEGLTGGVIGGPTGGRIGGRIGAAASGAVQIMLDGKLCTSPALPRTWTRSHEVTVCAGGRHLLGSPIRLASIRRVAGFVEAHEGGLRGWAWHPGDPDTEPRLLIRGDGGRNALRITATDTTASVQHAVSLARPRGFSVSAEALAAISRPLHVLGADGADVLGSPLDPAAEQGSAAAAVMALAHYLLRKPARVPPFAPPAIPADIAAPRLMVGRQAAAGPATGKLTTAKLRTGKLTTDKLATGKLGVGKLAAGVTPRRRQVDVVIPVYGEAATALACLDSVLDTVGAPSGIIVIDDASPEPALSRTLDTLAASGRIRLLRHARNLGFPASVNDGIAAAQGRDVVLLNSDTLVPPGWLERLSRAAYAADDIGTATPFSNHASILSYPGPQGSNPVPSRAEAALLDTIARRANQDSVVDIPVGVGFCLYLRRDCIDQVGPFRAEVFAQGYGEENDFCLRARHLGWRHVAVPGLFVAHLGGVSFGQAGRHLQIRNERLLNRLHPGYDALITAFSEADPLAEARRRFDLERWRSQTLGEGARDTGIRAKAIRQNSARGKSARKTVAGGNSTGKTIAGGNSAGDRIESVVLVTHDDGGGVERQVGVSAASHRAAGLRPVVLRPEPSAEAPGIVVVDGAAAGFPNLRYALPQEMPALLGLLRGTNPRLVEVHHTLHHPPAIYDLITHLGVPYDVHIHDYPWFCPQVSLVGATRRYCGEPAVVQCEACVADAGRVIDEPISVQALRDRSAAFLAAARRVVAPSADAAERMRRHFRSLRPTIVPLEDDGAVAEPPAPRSRSGMCRVCVLGAIGVHKGYDVLLACARDAAERGLPIEFVVVGHTIDDARLLATGRVFVTGRFAPEEAVGLIRTQDASLALLPSVWPETWNFGLTELWRAGLSVAAFDFGAPAERIRRSGRGFLLPLGLPPRGINHALVAAVGLTGHEGARNVDETLHHPSIQETSKHPWQERRDSRPSACPNQPPRS